MGIGAAQNNNQVYYDPSNGQYYTHNNQYDNESNTKPPSLRGYSGFMRNYLNGFNQDNAQKSPINDLLAQSLAAKANPVSMAQLFPSMSNPSMSNPMTNYSGLLGNQMQGQYGAGRFLGGNSMANYGSTSNAMNTM